MMSGMYLLRMSINKKPTVMYSVTCTSNSSCFLKTVSIYFYSIHISDILLCMGKRCVELRDVSGRKVCIGETCAAYRDRGIGETWLLQSQAQPIRISFNPTKGLYYKQKCSSVSSAVGWLVSDNPACEEAGCGGPGQAWLQVVCGCEAGWTYC